MQLEVGLTLNQRATRLLTFVPFFIFHLLVSTHAQPLTGRWIGVHTEWDLNLFCTLPAYMDFNPDSTWQLGLVDESEAPRTGHWGMEGRVLRLDTTHYAPELVSVQGDLLRIGRVQPMLFRRFRAVPMARETVWQRLSGQVWQSDSVQYLIAADGRVGIRNRKTGVQTVHYAEVLAMDKSAFLIIRGSANGREGNIRAFWQVTSNEVGVIKLMGGLGSNVGTETLRWVRPFVSSEPLQPTEFQLCTNCFGRTRQITFFGISESNEQKIVALIRQRYQPVDAPDQSGLIMLRLVRNCAGELGRIELKELDDNYRNRLFDKRVTDQLRAIVCTNLPSNLFDNGNSPKSDMVISFTFRVVDGRITDLF